MIKYSTATGTRETGWVGRNTANSVLFDRFAAFPMIYFNITERNIYLNRKSCLPKYGIFALPKTAGAAPWR